MQPYQYHFLNVTYNATGHDGSEETSDSSIYSDMGFLLLLLFMFIAGCYNIAIPHVRADDDGTTKYKAAGQDLILSHLIVCQWSLNKTDDTSIDHSPQNEASPIEQASCHNGGNENSDATESEPNSSHSSTDEEMGACSDVVSEEIDFDNFDGCAICLAPYEYHQEVCESNNLSCKHMFHTSCMVVWLGKHNQCPVCRQVYVLETAETN